LQEAEKNIKILKSTRILSRLPGLLDYLLISYIPVLNVFNNEVLQPTVAALIVFTW
jgi:hypothetical protein